MSLQFYFGASGAGKSHQVYESVIARSLKERDTEFLVIVPDQFTMQTQKEFVNKHPNGGILNIDVLSFGRLSHRILSEVGCEEKDVLDDTGKCLLLRKLVLQTGDQYPLLGRQLQRPGYIREVKSIFSEFMQYGLEPESVHSMSDAAENRFALRKKLDELGRLYELFLKEIRQKYATKEELPVILSREISKSNIIPKSVLVFDGFTGFTPVQNLVIRELMIYAKEVIVTLAIGDECDPYRICGEDDLFYLSQKTVRSLMKIAEENQIIVKDAHRIYGKPVYRHRDNEELAHLESQLFRSPQLSYTKETNNIRIVKALSPKEEAQWISYEMRKLIKNEGYSYRDFAVITGDLERYRDEISEQLSKYSVPFYIDTTRSLSLNPFVEFLRSGIRVVAYNYRYADVFHFLRCGISCIGEQQADCLDNYVCALGIRGKNMWSSPFVRYSKELQKDAQALGNLEQSRIQLCQLFSVLQSEEGECTVRERVLDLYRFALAADAERKLSEYKERFIKEQDLAKAKEYEQIYRVVFELLEQFCDLMGEDLISWKDFADILDAGLAEIRIGTLPQTVDRVLIGDMVRTRLSDIKVLFFIGVNDGIIPKSGSSGGILSDLDREFLVEQGQELKPTPRQQIFTERLYLYLNMTKPTERLYLTYASVSAEGKSLLPAYLITDVSNLFPMIKKEKWEGKQFLDRIHTPEDGLEQLAELLRSYSEGVLTDVEQHLLYSLYAAMQQDEYDAAVSRKIVTAAFASYRSRKLPSKLIRQLYGELVSANISSLERFASCAYAHYLQYGLRLRERENYSFEVVDLGNVYHEVLRAYGEYIQQEDLHNPEVMKEADRVLDEIVEHVAATYGENVLNDGAKNQYRIQQMKRILKRTVHTIQYQLAQGHFYPFRFEAPFEKTLLIDDKDNLTVRFRGRIDRIDLCENQGRVYVKVVDYKSGNKDFDIEKLYLGLQLQLPIYLERALEAAKAAKRDQEVVPSAMLYYRIQDPIPDCTGCIVSEEFITEEIRKKLVPKGVVCLDERNIENLDSDFIKESRAIPVTRKTDGSVKENTSVMTPTMFQNVLAYALKKAKILCREMMDGNIAINPFAQGNTDACTYCSYKSACAFDAKLPGYVKRQAEDLNYDVMISEIETCRGEDNDELHETTTGSH